MFRWCSIVVAAAILTVAACGCGGAGSRWRASSDSSALERAQIAGGGHAFSADANARPLGDEDDDETGAPGRVGASAGDNDADFDNDRLRNRTYFDADDGPVRRFGRAATNPQRKVLIGVVESYLADAAAADGSGACSMLEPAFAATVVKTYGKGSAGPTYLRSAASCQAVLSLLFKRERRELSPPPRIVGVRVGAAEARVLLASPVAVAGYLSLRHEARRWRLTTLLATAFR